MRYLYKGWVMSVVLTSGVAGYSSILHAENTQSREAARKALAEIRQNISVSRKHVAFLANQIDRLKKDQRTVTDALIKVAKAERDAANDIAEREKELEQLIERQEFVRQNLRRRRAEFSEVLAILERMGLKPIPALLARPEDVLASIRSSILLGTVIPEMQEKTHALTVSLKELSKLDHLVTAEYKALKAKMQNQAEQRKYLELLLNEKEKLQIGSEKELAEQRQRNVILSKKAQSLEEMISEFDHRSQLKLNSSAQMRKNLQLLERFDFESRKGSLFLPVSGKKIQQFNSGSRAARFGEIIATEPAAVVTAPTDAFVAFAGPFRSYGQLIILNVGRGYHIILIGMSKINVNQGQFVLSGEPLGRMGTQFIANAFSLDIGKSVPMLYIEFRKRGKPVNPNLWWRIEKSGRNQNDS
ncbi:filament-A percursor [Bartonella australis AUST/NH1]|uniref:Filament-A percursor n=2 Tax=Bartonella australis TaxID=388640 RepID=M1NS53_BARAA|nr:peptidoglycan DD-metalloendopeptidase family protein [Bartonella australis]AGF74173.1 filament-A percursor [Bartonella australis AUST/NH1]